jgi:SsrA-binding protein
MEIVNRKAKYDYEFLRMETTGIELVGSEIKSIRASKVSIAEAFCVFENGELFLKNAIIKENGTAFSHEENRDRKLLMKRSELDKLQKDLVKGLTIVPYRIIIGQRGWAKVIIALAKGKKNYDKRETIKKRETEREIRNEKTYK